MRPALAVHLHLLATLPVRTHLQTERHPGKQGVKPTNIEERKRRALAMHAAGASWAEIDEKAGLSRRTLQVLLGRRRV